MIHFAVDLWPTSTFVSEKLSNFRTARVRICFYGRFAKNVCLNAVNIFYRKQSSRSWRSISRLSARIILRKSENEKLSRKLTVSLAPNTHKWDGKSGVSELVGCVVINRDRKAMLCDYVGATAALAFDAEKDYERARRSTIWLTNWRGTQISPSLTASIALARNASRSLVSI